MKDVRIRPLFTDDWKLIDAWRRRYLRGDLEYPHGLAQPGVETCVTIKGQQPIAALTGIKAVVLDPFAHDPEASPLDLIYGLLKMETTLTYMAQSGGAVDSYIAVPESETAYLKLLQEYGYHVTVQNCVVLRRPLVPDHVPLLGEERDRAARKAQEEMAEEVRVAELVRTTEEAVCVRPMNNPVSNAEVATRNTDAL